MFHNFTLYPGGGAFMLCESVGEFDENVPLPATQEVPSEIIRPMVSDGDDPVIKAIALLSPVYERSVMPLLHMVQTYNPQDPQEGFHKVESISSSISDIAYNLRRVIGTLDGIRAPFSRGPMDYTVESFAAHLGLFMKNVQTVKRQGIEFSEFTYRSIPAFCDAWYISDIVKSAQNNPILLNTIIGDASMRALAGDRIADTFESTIDLIQCVYGDSDRLYRLESNVTRKLNFEQLMRTGVSDNETECLASTEYKLPQEFYRLISRYLRTISQECYDLECRMTDDLLTEGEFVNTTGKLLSQCVNLFAIGTMVALTIATDLRGIVARKKGVDEYTNTLCQTLESILP